MNRTSTVLIPLAALVSASLVTLACVRPADHYQIEPTRKAATEAGLTVLHSSTAPLIDGNLSEYIEAPAIIWSLASGGNTATVRALWNSQALYLAYDVTDTQLRSSVTDRDGRISKDDAIEWFVDTLNDGGSGMFADDYQGLVNVRNIQGDMRGSTGGTVSLSWNGTWQSAVATAGTVNANKDTDTGYTIEVAIPWTTLGLSAAPSAGSLLGIGVAVDDKDGSSSSSAMYPDITSGFQDASKWQKALLSSPSGSGTQDASSDDTQPASPDSIEPDAPSPPASTPLLALHDGNNQSQKIQDFINWIDPNVTGVINGRQDVIRKLSWNTISLVDSWDRDTARNLAAWVLAKPGRWTNYSMAIIPTTHAGQLAEAAAGNFDPYFTDLANNLATEGLANPQILVVFRPGYEWDGGWFPWGVNNNVDKARLFAEFWRRIVTKMRQAQPNANWKFDWNPTHAAFLNRTLLDAAWPGSEYVDLIGIDVYDRGGTLACTDFAGRWNWVKQRLEAALSYANLKGKPLTIPEWGIWNDGCTGEWGSGTDNPDYVDKMHAWIGSNAASIFYTAFYNEGSRHRLNPPTISPNASDMFKTRFGR